MRLPRPSTAMRNSIFPRTTWHFSGIEVPRRTKQLGTLNVEFFSNFHTFIQATFTYPQPHQYYKDKTELTIPEDLKRDFGENEIGKKANDHGWIVYIIASDNTIDKTMWTPESLALKHWKNNFTDLKDKIKLYIKDLIAIINQNKEKLDNPYQQ